MTIPSASFLCRVGVSFGLALFVGGCAENGAPGDAEEAESRRKDFTHPEEIRVGEDGLARREGETDPFTGAVVIRDSDWNLRHFGFYQDGKLHGPEMRFWKDGKVRRIYDFEAGEKVRHREWYENGNPKTDAIFVGGQAQGPHRTWYEDGRPRWSGNLVGELQWDGHITDYSSEGELVWDAVYDHGKYVSGLYPESEQEAMIEIGMLRPEDAIYPLGGAESEDEAGKPGE
ncbi:hypothetical protein BH23VER1_BH23VER1_28190 [soil metagenome]